VLARRIGFLSALRAPSVFLPGPDLSECVEGRLRRAEAVVDKHGFRAGLAMMPCPDFLHICNKLLRAAGDGRRISRYVAPP
jgi:hypothetical protein